MHTDGAAFRSSTTNRNGVNVLPKLFPRLLAQIKELRPFSSAPLSNTCPPGLGATWAFDEGFWDGLNVSHLPAQWGTSATQQRSLLDVLRVFLQFCWLTWNYSPAGSGGSLLETCCLNSKRSFTTYWCLHRNVTKMNLQFRAVNAGLVLKPLQAEKRL